VLAQNIGDADNRSKAKFTIHMFATKLQKPIEGKIHHSYVCNSKTKTSKTDRKQNSPLIRLQQKVKNQSKVIFTIHTFAIVKL
jgi:hypothetical protein